MFRSCGRAGIRFASGNVFYMNRTFSARHLQCVSSPLSTGFVSPMRFLSATGTSAMALTFPGAGALDTETCASLTRGEGFSEVGTLASLAEVPVLCVYTALLKAPYTWGATVGQTKEIISVQRARVQLSEGGH